MLKISPFSTFESLSDQEWLISNGIGGFASSTLSGANTRRYHGLLTAALQPPTGRTVLVSKVEECIVFGRDCAFSLSSNRYPGTVHPSGYQYLRFFESKPFPRMKFEAGGYHLLKTVFMVRGSNTVVVEYENTGENPFKLRLTPLFVYRDYHSLFRRDDYYDFHLRDKGGYFESFARFGAQPLYFKFTAGEWRSFPNWYYNFVYERESERGLDDREDACSPGEIETLLRPGDKTFLVFSTDEAMMKADPEKLRAEAAARLENMPEIAGDDPFLQDLIWSGDQFIVRRAGGGHSILAGYHWFTDWGRDTMIAVRGLCIATGRQEMARSILQNFLQYVDRGMLPNRFPDTGETPEYNTIDAALWLFTALYEYYKKFRDGDFITSVFDRLAEILDAHIQGTRYGIGLTPEGFLKGGEGTAQLTWMDARIGDYVVTPRHGCPVEIQALWYNALRIYQYFARTLDRPFETYSALADRLQRNFKSFFLQPDGSLYDVVVPGESADPALRPNQIFAVSLPFSLLSREEEKKVVDAVKKQLLTPYGLRTLSPDDPQFKPVYRGSPLERDSAYHQGTVWPFLLGEYAAAFLRVNDWSEKSQKEVRELLEPLKRHFYTEGCLYGISEVFDGADPAEGKGAVHQAWSVGAMIKILTDLKNITPKRKNGLIPFIPQTMTLF